MSSEERPRPSELTIAAWRDMQRAVGVHVECRTGLKMPMIYAHNGEWPIDGVLASTAKNGTGSPLTQSRMLIAVREHVPVGQKCVVGVPDDVWSDLLSEQAALVMIYPDYMPWMTLEEAK